MDRITTTTAILHVLNTRTCGECVFWMKKIDPANVRDVKGECHQAPPSVGILQVGPGRMQVTASYPILPPNYPCCAQFRERFQDRDEASATREPVPVASAVDELLAALPNRKEEERHEED